MATTKKDQAPATTEAKQPTDADLRSQAYNTATRLLRDRHRDEFTELVKAEAEKLGVTYTPRLTAEQRAEQKMQALLEEFPNLKAKVASVDDADQG